jgi:hypothetical protein
MKCSTICPKSTKQTLGLRCLCGSTPTEMDDPVSEDIWDDESPLMQAWDNV